MGKLAIAIAVTSALLLAGIVPNTAEARTRGSCGSQIDALGKKGGIMCTRTDATAACCTCTNEYHRDGGIVVCRGPAGGKHCCW